MKNWIGFFGLLLAFTSNASIVVMPRIDAKLFINKPRTDFNAIYLNEPAKLEKAVTWLFNANQLNHEMTKSMDSSFQFNAYWKVFQASWHLIDMNHDGNPELIFSGKPFQEDVKEQFSLYVQYGLVWKEVFWDDGHLLAFKIHPRTQEILLYQHRYPCCTQSTHSVNRLRWLKNRLYEMKRFFLARDKGDMKGVFFPRKSVFKANYQRLNSKTMLYWSKGFVTKGASLFSETNAIIHYPAGAYYKLLAVEDKWMYVQMVSSPVMETSAVANAENLKTVKYFGWMKVP
jgi:hypothetical protein